MSADFISGEHKPTVAIILVNWNGWQDSIACIQSCLQLHDCAFRIVLCDNASSDGSVEKILDWASGELAISPDTRSPVKIEHARLPSSVAVLDRVAAERGDKAGGAELVIVQTGSNLGFAGGNNVGLRWAMRQAFDYAWLLNNDTVVPPNSLAALIEGHSQQPSTGICGSLMVEYYRPDRAQALCGAMDRTTLRARHVGAEMPLPEACTTDISSLIRTNEVAYPIGASMLVDQRFLHDIGLMEEEYFLYYEEIDWIMRSQNKFNAQICKESIVYHKVGASAGSTPQGLSPRSVAFLYRSRLLFAKRFAPEKTDRVVLAMLWDSAKAILRGRTAKAVATFRVLFGQVDVPNARTRM